MVKGQTLFDLKIILWSNLRILLCQITDLNSVSQFSKVRRGTDLWLARPLTRFLSNSQSGFLPEIFFRRAKSIVMQIYFVMLIFLLLSDHISEGAKVYEGGKLPQGGVLPRPPLSGRNPAIGPQIHVEIALNLVKAWNLVQMKLLSCGSRIDLGGISKMFAFCLYGNMAAPNASVVH